MIDWIDAIVPCWHSRPINGGTIRRMSNTGAVEWEKGIFRIVRGSWETGIQLKTFHADDSGECTHLLISGNPAKFWQGHNLWGTNDLHGLLVATLVQLVAMEADSEPAACLGLSPTPDDIAAWFSGHYRVTRADITESFHLDSQEQCIHWIRAAESSAYMKNRGKGTLRGNSTLEFGKGSRRSRFKIYAKGPEISAQPEGQPALAYLPHAKAWAAKTLRCELEMRSLGLKHIGLSTGENWIAAQYEDVLWNPVQLVHECLGNMTMMTTTELSDDVLSSLKPACRMAYLAWNGGADLRANWSKSSFYRTRAALLEHGVDIAVVQDKDVSRRAIAQILTARPAPVPDWAEGTALLFEPPARPAMSRDLLLQVQTLMARRAA